MDFKSYLYRSIGHRIRVRRKSMNFRQTDFDGIDFGILSKIENGKAVLSRNPYLLNEYQLSILKNTLGYKDISEIVWGTIEEQEHLVKTILLYILINGGHFAVDVIDNPFIPQNNSDKLIHWAKKQAALPESLLKDIVSYIHASDSITTETDENIRLFYKSIIDNKDKLISAINTFFLSEYNFFYNHENYVIFEKYFKSTHPTETVKLQPIADTILKQLLHNYHFAVFYSNCVHNYLFNVSAEKPELNVKVRRFLLHPSTCIDFAFDYIPHNNPSFIYAFNKNWDANKDNYMAYFDSKLFHEPTITESGLKKFSNEYFLDIITSNEFLDVCDSISIIDTFFEPEAILATNYMNTITQQLIQTNMLITENTSSQSFFQYLANSASEIRNCASDLQID